MKIKKQKTDDNTLIREILNSESTTILKKDHDKNVTIFKGKTDNENVILIFRPHIIDNNVSTKIISTEKVIDNNRFYKYLLEVHNKADLSLIYPAMAEDIKKFTPSEKIRLLETPQMFNQKYRKIADTQDLTWIYNILDGIAELDNIFFQNEHFVLMPDIKWDGNIESLYCLAIVKDKNISSIRDLNNKHLHILNSIYSDGGNAIFNKFGVKIDNLRFYFHYHPTFWHLHVHINVLNSERFKCDIDSSISLHDVIQNITFKSDYYQTATLEIVKKIN